MSKLTRNLMTVLVLALVGVGAAWGYSVCVTGSDPQTGCVYHRSCCFYSDATGEFQGCWEMNRPCDL